VVVTIFFGLGLGLILWVRFIARVMVKVRVRVITGVPET